ncbi:brain and acute leukemia cytoplasmic protein-like isoform X1 [Caretta caretta]|uniref:brain and acute leukemia cytoplasmic protein-like isoform X1 n=2 Tax=Caretta caretta TaxID=8467 RepID=UPI00209614A2|nr:brain and acute leukemia cytoplasmic protein-like isoform X1 [Caretta caretta]XP_048698164.1 brain and acute leukemia cytoplasmic protein-like isoform X1 [Caretta caretta]
MGCGGSRTDGLEPRYRENWTKETESTWLMNTDADIPLSALQTIPQESSPGAAFDREKSTMNSGDFFDDGIPNPAQAYLKVCSVMSDLSLNEVKAPAGGSQVTHKPLNGLSPSGTTLQKKSVLCTEETKWRSNRMANKQVTIMVTQNIQQIDTSGRIIGTSCTTYGLANPVGEKGKA